MAGPVSLVTARPEALAIRLTADAATAVTVGAADVGPSVHAGLDARGARPAGRFRDPH